MSKRLKAFLASLLVISLLVTSLSFAALSEAAPAAPAETQTIAPTEEPVIAPTEEPAIESTETPAVESTEEPVEEPTEEPAVESTEEPTEEPAAEATEEPTEEPVEEPTVEPTEAPAAELSDAQKAALENLPAGFSAGTVALAMMQSSGCEHTNLWVDENSNEPQYSSINDEKHLRTYTVKSRTLKCEDCGKALQTIAVNETITEEGRHEWVIKSVGKKITIECYDCQKTKTISKPCSHNSFGMGEDGNLHCTQCSKQSVLNPEQTYCKHTNYTEYGTKASPLVEYQAYSKEQHVKHSEILVFSNGSGFATCDDCGIWLELENGKVISVGITDYVAEDSKIESALEAHTFENGACKFCGETAPKDCDHSAGNFRDELDKSIALKYDNITETTHCVQYSYKRYCKDCGEYIQNVLDEGVTPVAHDFSKGNTCACGYMKEENNKIIFISPKDGDSLPIATEINVTWKPVKDADGYVYTAIAHSNAWSCGNIKVDRETFTIKKDCTYDETGIDITVSAWKEKGRVQEIIATGKMTVYVEEDRCTKYGHTYDDGYYKEKHPHNKILTCTVCGHTYTLGEFGYFDNCLDCICPHNKGYIIEGHPHKYAYCKACNKRFETWKDLWIAGKFSDCNECFSLEGYSQNRARELAAMAEESYNMRAYGTGTTLNRWEIADDNRNSFGNAKNPTTEALITTSLTADGKLVVTIAFEGSQDLADDWIRDMVATAQNGVHAGVYNAMERFIGEYVNNDKHNMLVSLENRNENINRPYSFKQLLTEVKNTDGARLCITGHSYGGALAQYFTYYAIEEFGISPDKIETYTFASMIPFTDDFVLNHRELQEANIFNFIDIRDLVPDVGVTAEAEMSIRLSDGHWEKLLIDSTFWDSIYENLDVIWDRQVGKDAAIGGFNKSGCNIGTNVYMDSGKDADVGNTLINIHGIKSYMNLLNGQDDAVVGELNAIDIVAQKTAYKILKEMKN